MFFTKLNSLTEDTIFSILCSHFVWHILLHNFSIFFTIIPWYFVIKNIIRGMSEFHRTLSFAVFTVQKVYLCIEILRCYSLSRVWLCDLMGSTVHGILQARILECVAFPFSKGSSQPRHQTQFSHIAGGFFTNWATREAQTF